MLDVKWIRQNPEALDAMLKKRGAESVSSTLLEMDEKRRSVMTALQALQSERNSISKEIGNAKANGQDAAPLFAKMKDVGPKMKTLEEQERTLVQEFDDFIATLPNLLAENVPEGVDEEDNLEISRLGVSLKCLTLI